VPGMAYREYLDSDGRSWRVWSTVPSAGSRLHGGFGQGWLTFECTSAGNATVRRRLAPIPKDWESAPNEQLELMCESADDVSRSTPPRGRDSAPESAERQ